MAPFLFLHHYMDATFYGDLIKGSFEIGKMPLMLRRDISSSFAKLS